MIVVTAVRAVFTALELIILAEVIWSWIDPNPYNPQPARVWLRRLSEPLLSPFRRFIPPIGGALDISPIVALLLLRVLERVIIGAIDPYGGGY